MIIADNGSTDGSQSLAKSSARASFPITARGYGSALRGGIAAARGEYVIMGDADDSYDFTQLGDFVAKLREGYDLVMGNRFRGGIRPGAMPFLHRYLGNPVLELARPVVFRLSRRAISNAACAASARTRIERLDLRTTGMEFSTEMVVKATLFELRITEIPTTLSPRRARAARRTCAPGATAGATCAFFCSTARAGCFSIPAPSLFLFGIAVGLWLLPGPRTVGGGDI